MKQRIPAFKDNSNAAMIALPFAVLFSSSDAAMRSQENEEGLEFGKRVRGKMKVDCLRVRILIGVREETHIA